MLYKDKFGNTRLGHQSEASFKKLEPTESCVIKPKVKLMNNPPIYLHYAQCIDLNTV